MSKLLFNSVIITTGTGIVLYKHNGGSGNPAGNYNKTINLINSMVTDTYINYNPQKQQPTASGISSALEGISDIKTYSRNNEVLKYLDLNNQGAIFIAISYSALSNKAGGVNRIQQFLVHLKDLFSSVILEEVIGKNFSVENLFKGFDFVEVKKTIAEKKFQQYVEQLVTKVETDDINIDSDDSDEDESAEELSEEEEDKRVVEKKKLKSKKTALELLKQKSGKKALSKNQKASLKQKAKQGRRWTDDGGFVEDNNDYDNLDFTGGQNQKGNEESDLGDTDVSKLVSSKNYGQKTKEGFVINDLSQEIDNILSSSSSKAKSQDTTTKTSSAFGFLKKYIGGKTITEQDLDKSSKIIKENLIKKNVSAEIADKLVSSLKPSLLGSKTKNFTSIETQIKASLQAELTKILTPNTSIDLLHEIYRKQANAQAKSTKEPYVISIVGVNGVGKSTNLSKLAYWLLNNKFNVLIAACDTFRSGAVEQLKVHERNLNKLITSMKLESKLQVFEQGYGNLSKVSLIAKNSIQYARDNDFDIVLMDTAGRRHNDSKLMAPLKDFAIAAKPDKIIMVGEALVGTDSVMQAANFNKSFSGANRQLDFFIISKCDTVGDLIGTMVNMVYSTGIPILFVGVGQTYTDLRTLSVEWAVDTLMS